MIKLKRPIRPRPLAVNKDKIPRALRQLRNWVLWRYVLKSQDDGTLKWTKIPFQPNRQAASSTDPRTWSTFDTVCAAHERGGCDGIGFVTSPRDPFVLIDLDKVRDPKTGAIVPWATKILEAALQERAYVELSPSATGFHVIAEGPQGFTGKKANDVEMYCSGRYFTITSGLRFDPKQRALCKLDKTIELVSARLGIPKPSNSTRRSSRKRGPAIVGVRPYPDHWTDADILKLAFTNKNGDKLKRLLDGDTSDYRDNASDAEMAAVCMLSFWFWLNADAIERVMRNSQLERPKWDTKRPRNLDFLQYTIRRALDGKEDYYGKPCRLTSWGART